MTPERVTRLLLFLSACQASDPDLAAGGAHAWRLDVAERAGPSNGAAPVIGVEVALEAAGARVLHRAVLRLAAGAGRHPF